MADKSAIGHELRFWPLTEERWSDFERLFGERGACGGCWCMWWRQTKAEFDQQKGEKNKEAMRRIVKSGEIPGILAYHAGEPIAWCSVAPRQTYSALARSRILKPVDEQPVWSIVCFFVAKPFRKLGVTVKLLEFAKSYCKKQGAKILEGYPTDPKKPTMADLFAFTGLLSAFRQAGFNEVARRSATRPIMRCDL